MFYNKVENENPCQNLFFKNIVGRCSSESNSPIFIGCTMFILVNFSILGYVWINRIGLIYFFWKNQKSRFGIANDHIPSNFKISLERKVDYLFCLVHMSQTTIASTLLLVLLRSP
jgi:hypothetical protein